MLKQVLWLCTLFGGVFGLSIQMPVHRDDLAVLNVLQERYRADHTAFAASVDHIIQRLEASDTMDVIDDFIQLRKAYKRTEPLFAYFEEEGVVRWVNGAPLPKPHPVSPSLEVIKPKGLQTTEEALCEGDYAEAHRLLIEMRGHLQTMQDFEQKRKFQHRYIFEAMRLQLIRIYTLSLTGFDTPCASDGLDEAMISLEAMKFTFEQYMTTGQTEEVRRKASDIVQTITQTLNKMEDYSFDDLPRLALFRSHLMPLYQDIYALHHELSADFASEADRTAKPYDYHAKNIYDTEFLNPGYFSKVAESDLSDPKKIELGKTLFYDPALSRDLSMACVSCHRPDKAFTDGYAQSPTRDGHTTLRNAPSLINAVYANKYFWDLREYDLERQIKHVMYDHNEFDMDFIDLTDRLKESDDYLARFEEAYGDRDKYKISTWSISNALAAYVASLTAHNSPFDQYARGESDVLPEEAIRGHDLFMGKASCGTCHFAPTYSGLLPPTWKDTESEVLGVLTTHDTLQPTLHPDLGRVANGTKRDGVDFYTHSFKTVTVRNVELTAPYFHHGGYNTLEEVMDFYNRGGGAGMGLDVPHQTLPPDPLGLTQEEIGDIIAFMKSLTDTTGLNNTYPELPKFDDKPEWDDRQERMREAY